MKSGFHPCLRLKKRPLRRHARLRPRSHNKQEARRLKPLIKVVFVTGYDRTGMIGKLAADAATDFIDKPYDPDELVGSVRRLLRGQGGRP